VTVQNGGKLPLSSNGRFVTVRLETSAGTEDSFPVDAGNVGIVVVGNMDVRATVENLPDSYTVESVMYGTTNVTQGSFRLSGPPFTSVQSVLSITLRASPPVSGAGSRVTGTTGSLEKRLIYMSGKPGVVYFDGTFEFRDIPPGRHVIGTLKNPSMARAAIVVVGDRDVSGIALKETVLLPPDISDPKDPLPAGSHPPGTILPLIRVSGTVLDESSKEPIRSGELILKSGNAFRTFPIDQNGRFEPFSLVPGTYDIRFEVFGHGTLGPDLVVDDKDLDLQLTTKRLY
jgi:hypothetical protein